MSACPLGRAPAAAAGAGTLPGTAEGGSGEAGVRAFASRSFCDTSAVIGAQGLIAQLMRHRAPALRSAWCWAQPERGHRWPLSPRRRRTGGRATPGGADTAPPPPCQARATSGTRGRRRRRTWTSGASLTRWEGRRRPSRTPSRCPGRPVKSRRRYRALHPQISLCCADAALLGETDGEAPAC